MGGTINKYVSWVLNDLFSALWLCWHGTTAEMQIPLIRTLTPSLLASFKQHGGGDHTHCGLQDSKAV